MKQSGKGFPARMVTVDEDSAGRRIDNFLLSYLKGLPRTRIYRMIRKGEVRVNKGRIRAGYKVAAGDVVRVPPVRLDPPRPSQTGGADWIEQHIVFEDAAVLVLNKPSGLAVHGGSGISRGAIELLRAVRPQARFLELVHRLDRATSGCLLVAKKRSALRALHEQFRDGGVTKIYTALVNGVWEGGEREVSLPLVVEHRRNGERHVRTGADGKEALTRFAPVEMFGSWALLRVELFTGRTHQIRVHSAAIGHPVSGDERYGEPAGDPPGLRRLFLHAAELGFQHPLDGDWRTVTAALDPELQQNLDALRAKCRGD